MARFVPLDKKFLAVPVKGGREGEWRSDWQKGLVMNCMYDVIKCVIKKTSVLCEQQLSAEHAKPHVS